MAFPGMTTISLTKVLAKVLRSDNSLSFRNSPMSCARATMVFRSSLTKIVLPTVPIESQWFCVSSKMDLQRAEPQLEDGSVYRQNRPTKLDSNR